MAHTVANLLPQARTEALRVDRDKHGRSLLGDVPDGIVQSFLQQATQNGCVLRLYANTHSKLEDVWYQFGKANVRQVAHGEERL